MKIACISGVWRAIFDCCVVPYSPDFRFEGVFVENGGNKFNNIGEVLWTRTFLHGFEFWPQPAFP